MSNHLHPKQSTRSVAKLATVMTFNRDRAPGFSLIELLIAMAIMGILAAISIPSYRSYVIKSYRSAAQTKLVEVVSRQEGRFVDRKTYTTQLSKLGYPANPFYITNDGTAQAAATDETPYKIELRNATAASFVVAAVPQGAQANDTDCKTLTLSSSGVKGVADSATASASDCW